MATLKRLQYLQWKAMTTGDDEDLLYFYLLYVLTSIYYINSSNPSFVAITAHREIVARMQLTLTYNATHAQLWDRTIILLSIIHCMLFTGGKTE